VNERRTCTFQPFINENSSEIVSQSDKYRHVDAFLDRVEVYKEKKGERLKKLEEDLTKGLTFKPKTYSKNDVASKYYERQMRKIQLTQGESREQI